MGKTTMGWLAALAVLAAGCDSTYHARVSDGAGMGQGAPVLVSGVEVGEVKGVAITEGEVDVEFSVSSDHEITMRSDTCVLAVRGEQGAGLVVMPGEGAPLSDEALEQPLPECRLPGSELEGVLGELGGAFGSMLRALGQGLAGGLQRGSGGGSRGSGGGPVPPTPQIPRPLAPAPPMPTPSPPTPSPPGPAGGALPPPPDRAGGCEAVSIRVDQVEPVAAVPLLLPSGGHRVWFVFENASDEAMRIGPVSQATFTDQGRRALTVAQLPSEANTWFMPVTVPAGGSARASVVFDTREPPRLVEIEARMSGPVSQPLGGCAVRQRFEAP